MTVTEGGNKRTLRELQKLIEEDASLKNLSKDREQELISTLEEHRALKATGARANRRAAAIDATKNVDGIIQECKNLYLRTGVRTIVFFTRSHADNRFDAMFAASNPTSLKFFPQILKLDAGNVATKFELFACAEEKAGIKIGSTNTLRMECTWLIVDGLRKITQDKKINMNYQNYETVIIEAHHVKLVGWPEHVPFATPANLTTKDEILLLRSALKDGVCHWKVLSHKERMEHAKRLEDARASGVMIGVKHKPRRDKGKPRKKKSAGTSSQMPPKFKSRDTIDDEEDQQTNNEEDACGAI
ncbi:hypothetical protein C0992_010306 [Termitomyces sp. T32_za158]|nr:hypothetical protein C0992_010306 [Termitomyces sp. T32_za158]